MNLGRLIIFAFLLATPTLAQTEKTDLNPSSLITAALENGAGRHLIGEYTFRLKVTLRRLNRGAPTTGTAVYETYAPTVKISGATKFVLLKIEENGVAVSPHKLQAERQQKSEELVRADEEARQQNAAEVPPTKNGSDTAKTAYFTIVDPSGIWLSVETILQNCEVKLLRTEMVDERATAVLSFRLKPAAELNSSELWLAKINGTLWIDLADKVLMRLSAWAKDDVTQKSKPLAYYESQLMSDGQWLPREGQINGINNGAVFGKLDTDLRMVFSKYERFNADIQDVKITSPQRKP